MLLYPRGHGFESQWTKWMYAMIHHIWFLWFRLLNWRISWAAIVYCFVIPGFCLQFFSPHNEMMLSNCADLMRWFILRKSVWYFTLWLYSLYCCPDCPNCLANALQTGQAVWAAVTKYSPNLTKHCIISQWTMLGRQCDQLQVMTLYYSLASLSSKSALFPVIRWFAVLRFNSFGTTTFPMRTSLWTSCAGSLTKSHLQITLH